jgi:hypothetical protein
MSEIEELSSRIMSAMDRVAAGLDRLAQVDDGEAAALRQALEDEKQVNAQLTERVRVLGERQEQAMATMEAKAAEAAERMMALDTEVQQVRKAQEMLSEACEALREANAAGVGDADLINRAMSAEIDALRAMRRAELAEADQIIAGLMPLLNASAQARTTEEAQ